MLSPDDIFNKLIFFFLFKYILSTILMFFLCYMISKWFCAGLLILFLIEKHPSWVSTLANWMILRRLVIICNVLLNITKLEQILFWPKKKFDNIKIFLLYSNSFQCMTIVSIIDIYAWLILKIVIFKFWIHCNQEIVTSFDIILWK